MTEVICLNFIWNDYIYYAYTDRRFILLHGFQKKTQKTPAKELELAQKYMEYFLARDAD